MALYFLSWLIVSGVESGGPLYLIFLTNWAFITYNMYLIISALSTTTKFLTVHFICSREDDDFSRSSEFVIKKPAGCCGAMDNRLSWYQMVHWLFFTLGNELALVILILYWSLLYSGGPIDGISANTHLVNGLVAVVDFGVTGVPINLFHFVYLTAYGAIYGLFTGLYFVGTGGDVVYPSVLDYNNSIGFAVGVVVGVVLVGLPLIHIIVFYLLHLVKYWVLYYLFGWSGAPLGTPKGEKEALEEDGERKSTSQV